MNANEGPAEIAAKISGVNLGGKREDDSAYFTNNEGHPWPDPYEIVLSEKDTSDCKTEPTARPSAGFLWFRIRSFCKSSRLSIGPRTLNVRLPILDVRLRLTVVG